MVQETILQHWVLTKFAYPFLLMFFIVFAVLEKTKVLGDKSKQLNAFVSFIISLIFVSAVFPKLVVSNLILFLSVALIVVFVALLLWGFVTGTEPKIGGTKLKLVIGIIVVVVLLVAVIWATGLNLGFLGDLFNQSWSKAFWTNFLFVVVIAVALALVIGKAKSGSD